MAQSFDFYYDFESPFAYLAATQLPALCDRTGAVCRYRPIFLAGLMKATGNRPPGEVPNKGRYLMQELQLWRKAFDVPLEWPVHFPLGELRPIRAAVYAFGESERAGVAFTQALYRAHWGERKDARSDAVVQAAAEAAGLDFAALQAAVQDPALKERLKAETEEAGGRGAFGVPTFFVGEQMLWGVDKLPWLEALLLGKPLTLPRCG
ncbi:MAG: 2-hydroxychromene-2-carboxylate isomerase [Deltaproteobacteria bacterium]|nr:2-hydroxychromene-2-carboxylate isomerase [Deltaproteobacteria bacterium]